MLFLIRVSLNMRVALRRCEHPLHPQSIITVRMPCLYMEPHMARASAYFALPPVSLLVQPCTKFRTNPPSSYANQRPPLGRTFYSTKGRRLPASWCPFEVVSPAKKRNALKATGSSDLTTEGCDAPPVHSVFAMSSSQKPLVVGRKYDHTRIMLGC
jgi:hypothetical protein